MLDSHIIHKYIYPVKFTYIILEIYMLVKECINSLKHRVLIARGVRTVQEVAVEMRVTPAILRAWLKDDANVRMSTLTKIEEWCDAVERRSHP